MFYLLTCLSLSYALQTSVSSDEAVSLNCMNTVSVTAEENVTLNCSISSTFGGKVCAGQTYDWRNTNGSLLCESDSAKYTCAWDALTYVSLTISNVQEEANVTAEILSNCGMVKSLPIRVQLISGKDFQTMTPPDNSKGGRPERSGGREESARVTTIVLCVFASAVVVFILYFLYRTYRHRVRERTVTCTAPASKDSTVV